MCSISRILGKYILILGTIYLLSIMIDTVHIENIVSLFIIGFVLMLTNVLLKPLLLLITLPFSILTLGLFTLVVNTWTIMIADGLVPGIRIGGFLNSLLAAFIIVILNHLIPDNGKASYRSRS